MVTFFAGDLCVGFVGRSALGGLRNAGRFVRKSAEEDPNKKSNAVGRHEIMEIAFQFGQL